MVETGTGNCFLCAGKCRGHSLGHSDQWEPEEGSQAWLVQNTRPSADEALRIAVEALEWLYNDNYNPFEPDNQTMACNIISQALAKIKELGK